MKSTGVVRRIDDLGRIVIPKEIRRTLRIRDGESLEIFVDSETISLKKFSKMTDIEGISKELVDIINNNINKNILVTDRDKFIAASGNLRKKYIDKNISRYLENVMKDRKIIIEGTQCDVELLDGVKDYLSYIICPIIMNGDAIGLLLILSDKDDISVSDEKIAYVTAQFLGKHIEE